MVGDRMSNKNTHSTDRSSPQTRCRFGVPMAAMASTSMNLTTTFIGLAKLQKTSIAGNHVPRLLRNITFRHRGFATTSRSIHPPIAAVSLSRAKRLSCNLSVAATAAPTQQYEDYEDSDVFTKIPPDNRIPAMFITGFLGLGKYGEVAIDGSLFAAQSVGVEDSIMLNNGCLCCTVRGYLVRMIGELVNKKKGKFDYIVIETTGLANPTPIIQTFYAEDQIFNDVKLDGVVTLVDAKHANIHLDDVKPKGVVNEAVEKIAYADRIIVNKTDLVGSAEVSALIQRIKGKNCMAELKRTEFGKVDLDYALGIGGFDLERSFLSS